MEVNLTEQLKDVEDKINGLSSDYIDRRGRAQIDNLIDKIINRKKMVNFKADITIAGKTEKIGLVQFLRSVDTEVVEKDKSALNKLEKQKIALELLIEINDGSAESEAPESEIPEPVKPVNGKKGK